MKYLFVILFSVLAVFSDDIADPDSLLEAYSLEMVITTSRSEKPLAKSPASVSVITKEDIENSSAKNIDDLLKSAMGVQMKRVTGFGEGIPSDIIIRGIPGALAASRTLLLVDGIPLNAGGTPSFIINEVSIHAIERVEVVRGPYSSLYGSNAFGGVINIITKSGEGRPSLNTVFETTWPFSIAHEAVNGSSNAFKEGNKKAYYAINGTFDGEVGKLKYLIDGGYRTVGNYLMVDTAFEKGPHGTINKSAENHDYRDVKVLGKAVIDINDKLKLTVQSRFFDSDLGFGVTKEIEGDDSLDIIMAGQKFLLGPNLSWSLSENMGFDFNIYFQRLIAEYWNEEPAEPFSIPAYWKSRADEWMLNISNNVKIGSYQTLTSGISGVYNDFNFGEKINYVTGETLRRSDVVNADAFNIALFLQDEIKFKNKVLIVPGFRFDYHSVFDFSLSPKLSMLFAFNDLFRIRGSLGHAFRAPNLAEYAMPDFSIDPTYSLKSNPNLKPEKVWAYEAAAVFSYKKFVELDVGGFYNNMTDLIGQGMVVPQDSSGVYYDSAYITHQNIDDAWSMGIEISLKSRFSDWVSIEGNMVIQNSLNETLRQSYYDHYNGPADLDTVDFSLDYIPRIKGGVILNLEKKFKNIKLYSNIVWLGNGTRFVKDLNLVDKNVDIHQDWSDGVQVYILPMPIKLEPYFTTDLSFGIGIKERYDISFKFINIFNEAYEESSGTNGTGRFATIKIGFKI